MIDPNTLPVGVSIVCTDGTIGGGSDPNVKNYSLTVCGKAVTSANCDNILGDPAGTTPRAVYDPDRKTLTLNGTIKAAAADTEQTGAIIKTEDALTITGNRLWNGTENGDGDDSSRGTEQRKRKQGLESHRREWQRCGDHRERHLRLYGALGQNQTI